MSEVKTHKQIAKWIKGHGFGKQHLYCQLCRKQTRSENSFQQHMTSEKHIQNALLFDENQELYIKRFSDDFEKGMVNVMKTRYRGETVLITSVHNQYITARSHTRLNGTIWETLEDFAKYLGREGIAEVKETTQGFFVKYKERDNEVVAKQDKIIKERQKVEREEAAMAAQIENARKMFNNDKPQAAPTELDLEKTKDIKFSFNMAPKASTSQVSQPIAPVSPVQSTTPTTPEDGSSSSEEETKESVPSDAEMLTTIKINEPTPKTPAPAPVQQTSSTTAANGSNGTPSTVDKKRKQTETPTTSAKGDDSVVDAKKKKLQRTAVWVTKGIVVKVMNKQLADGKLYKQKGVIENVVDTNVAIVKMIESGMKLKIDQSQLETVIPNVGGQVMIVNGENKGATGTMCGINEKKFCVQVKIATGAKVGTTTWEEYEDVCKLNK